MRIVGERSLVAVGAGAGERCAQAQQARRQQPERHGLGSVSVKNLGSGCRCD